MASGNIHNNLRFDGLEFAYAPNFSGSDPRGYNSKHERYFDVKLDEDQATSLIDEGWNVRTNAKDPDNPIYSLRVFVRFDVIPPTVWQITSNNRLRLNENNIAVLDRANIKHIDCVVRPYNWANNGKVGTKAMVDQLYVVIEEDPFFDRYADIPEADSSLPFDVD